MKEKKERNPEMKKFFALMLALCLALCAVSAFAEGNTNEVKQIKWSDFEEKKPEGAMTVIEEIGMKLFIPQELIQRTVSEEAAAKGIKMVLSNKDETAVVNAQISPVGSRPEGIPALPVQYLHFPVGKGHIPGHILPVVFRHIDNTFV